MVFGKGKKPKREEFDKYPEEVEEEVEDEEEEQEQQAPRKKVTSQVQPNTKLQDILFNFDQRLKEMEATLYRLKSSF